MSAATIARSTGRFLRGFNVSGLAVIVGLLVLWQAAISLGLMTFRYLPGPIEIAIEGWKLLSTGQLLVDIGHTLGTTVMATGIGTVIGIAIGLAFGLFPAVRLYSNSSIDFLRTIPVTALVPVALLIWGPSNLAEIVVATYAATWPILINTAGGVRAIPKRLYDVAAVFGLSRASTVTKVVIPASAQPILVGMRLGTVTALVLAIVAEMLINPHGLGWGLIQAQNALQPARLWAYTLTIGLLAYTLNALLVLIVRRALPGSVGQLEAAGQ
jgi:sulfonate transport system permease protein